MKKIFAMAVALIAAVTVNAQSLTDNYQKIYAGFETLNVFDSSADALKGFNVGYAYGINLTGHNQPLFLEVGAEYSFLSYDVDILKEKDHSLLVPLHVTWKFGNEKFAVAPFAGESLQFHLSHTMNDVSIFDGEGAHRFQATFDLGVNFVISSHLELGYRYQLSEMKFVDNNNNDYRNNFTIGYIF